MEPQKAFRQALITVAVGSLLAWGVLIYFVGVQEDDWFAYGIVVIVCFLVALALVYRRYRKGPRANATRRERILLAILYGCCAVTYLLDALVNWHSGWPSLYRWTGVLVWGILALDHLRRARQSKQVAQTYS